MLLLNSHTIEFPPTNLATVEGVLAVGGDLSVGRLLEAYEHGIFPWYEEGSEILWWSPNPRFVLFTEELKVSKSMKQVIRSQTFRVTYDTCFSEVIRCCKTAKRDGQEGTWITNDMERAYVSLHKEGYAHSVEVWQDNELVGGLYGVSIGRMFFGESMFTKVSNASKFGFISLVQSLKEKGFKLIDSQDYTAHVESLGGTEIPRIHFESILKEELKHPSKTGVWTNWLNP